LVSGRGGRTGAKTEEAGIGGWTSEKMRKASALNFPPFKL
jgi:hypothetical protein